MPQKYKSPEEFRLGGSKPNRIIARMVEYYGIAERQARTHLEQYQSAELSGDDLILYHASDEKTDEQFNREFDALYDDESFRRTSRRAEKRSGTGAAASWRDEFSTAA